MAQYFCSGEKKNEVEYKHYALNVPLYTHFTSPIRRYADIIVHRLLAAALSNVSFPFDPLNPITRAVHFSKQNKALSNL